MKEPQLLIPEVEESQKIHIDLSAIPDFRRDELARSVLASLERAMAEPGAEEEFQEWLKEYRAKKGRTATAGRGKEV